MQQYTLAQLQALNCTVAMLLAPDGVTQLSPRQYAQQFYNVDLGPGLAEGGCQVAGGQVYRLILQVEAGWATGANLPGCSPSTSNNCDPRMFDTLAAAVDFAYAHNELPYRVFSDSEAWAIVTGSQQPDSSRVLPPGTSDPSDGTTGGVLGGLSSTTLLVGGAVLLILFMRGRHNG